MVAGRTALVGARERANSESPRTRNRYKKQARRNSRNDRGAGNTEEEVRGASGDLETDRKEGSSLADGSRNRLRTVDRPGDRRSDRVKMRHPTLQCKV